MEGPLAFVLGMAKLFSRDKEMNREWEQMKQEKARDAAKNSHKEGWVAGGTAEKGHFVDRRGRKIERR